MLQMDTSYLPTLQKVKPEVRSFMIKFMQGLRLLQWMNLQMHIKVAGLGIHIMSDVHVDIMFPAGIYDVLQPKNISEPCCVPCKISRDWTKPFSGREGTPQPTGEGKNVATSHDQHNDNTKLCCTANNKVHNIKYEYCCS